MNRFLKGVKNVVTVGVIFAGLYGLMIVGSDLTRPLPDHVLVFASTETRTFFAPPLLEDDSRMFFVRMSFGAANMRGFLPVETNSREESPVISQDVLVKVGTKTYYLQIPPGGIEVKLITSSEAKDAKLEMDEEHRKQEAFWDTRSWVGNKLRRITGQPDRWNENGTWNW